MHTRYSPVRRSPPWCCHHAMPLDLHVLSLPLAFILSQDQTLRCSIFFLSFSLLPAARSADARLRVLDGGLPPSSFYVFLLSRNAYCCILSMYSYSRPAKGRTAKIGNPSGTRNSATRFFRKKIAGGGVVPRGRAPFPFCVCKGTHIAPHTQERSGLFSGRRDRTRRKMLCDTAL